MRILSARRINLRYIRKTILVAFLILALTVPPLANFSIGNIYAASPLTNYKIGINNSQSGATDVTYTFNWTTSGTNPIKQIDIQVCTTPSGTCNAPSGFSSGTPTLSADNIAGSGRTVSAPTANAFRVVVTTPATQSTQSMNLTFTGVTNPTSDNTTFYTRATTYSDTGSTIIDGPTVAAFAVLTSSSIAVTASVDPSFTFSIAGVSSGANFNGGSGNVDVTTTATTIPFGTLSVGDQTIAAHDVTISSNALNGYQVTASHSAGLLAGNPPLASGSANVDSFTGSNASPATWSSPNGTTASTNTGFFGYSTEDSSLCTGTVDRFTNGGPNWAGSSTTGGELICNANAVTGQTTRIGWAIEVNAYQQPGLYSGTAILIATPTY
ncbi:MAG TPA: hypothetical protein VLF20_03935 [Patescibacteria group bacterium]|nr:hypothetical protein [Patescibacteria group bacterium]